MGKPKISNQPTSYRTMSYTPFNDPDGWYWPENGVPYNYSPPGPTQEDESSMQGAQPTFVGGQTGTGTNMHPTAWAPGVVNATNPGRNSYSPQYSYQTPISTNNANAPSNTNQQNTANVPRSQPHSFGQDSQNRAYASTTWCVVIRS